MKFAHVFRKPRWLSRDAATRLLAITHDNNSDLVASLGRLAREDVDPRVRVAAMKRIADAGIAQGIAHDDVDAGVRAQARALWLDLLTGTHTHAPSLVERLRLLRAQDEPELIEHIARRAREPELRQAALERVTRTATLLERALEDSDADIRLRLVDRIDDEAQLARLAERARKTDKQVSRRARERIELARTTRGDGATLEQRARLLCEQAEHLIREPRPAAIETAIALRWADIEATAPESLRARFQSAQTLLAASRSAPSRAAASEAIVDSPILDQAAPASAPENGVDASTGDHAVEAFEAADSNTHVDAIVAPLLAQARFAASLDEANVEKRQQRERQQALLDQLAQTLTAVDAAIEAGASTQAHTAKARADELRRRLRTPLSGALAQQVAATDARYAELSRWQHWADNQRRRQLCDEIEALASAGIHPDAVASRVREAQTEWTRLDAIEARDASKPGGLTRQFHAACRAALAPTQAYFKKRHELRQSHAQTVAALLDRVAALGGDSGEPVAKTVWTALAALRGEIVEALRGLDSVEPRERKLLAQRLKASLTDIDARVARRDQDVERVKSGLIAQAQALGEGTPQRGAVAAARDLQQRWQAAGNGRHACDQAQWKMFRAAIDAVFARLDTERSERQSRDAQDRAQIEALCVELETLADATTPPERGAVARVQSAWDALPVRDASVERRFADAQSHLRDAAGRRERARRHARFDAWLARYRLCRAAEQQTEPAVSVSERWSAAAATDIAPTLLAQRFDAALGGVAPITADTGLFCDILLELEFLAGIEPAKGDREQRRLLQVRRLSARLSGDKTTTPADQLAALLARWTELGATADTTLDARLERSLAVAIETLP